MEQIAKKLLIANKHLIENEFLKAFGYAIALEVEPERTVKNAAYVEFYALNVQTGKDLGLMGRIIKNVNVSITARAVGAKSYTRTEEKTWIASIDLTWQTVSGAVNGGYLGVFNITVSYDDTDGWVTVEFAPAKITGSDTGRVSLCDL